ncbi:hypothetical protein EMPS_07544 [Entomortierella parvispora]|uniref:Uncharacterized protein n=1 Tax=Entomortierella parvispora TaxID=205924 RepID=A0A9P3HEB7_9FUNG|nr:hypothetical protein EMPS_07544 [Entomortierella parvispora]
MWTSTEYVEYMKNATWSLAEVRYQHQQYYKKTVFGYDDLILLWMGNVPWPDQRLTPDMRTNNCLQYWEDMLNAEIEKINEHYKEQGGMIDRLDSFRKYWPFQKTSPYESHFTAKQPVDAVVQVLVHKMNLCWPVFTPVPNSHHAIVRASVTESTHIQGPQPRQVRFHEG